MDEITTYSVYVNETNLANFSRSIRLSLASGGTAFIGFPAVRPADWLQFDGPITRLFMSHDHYAEVYHVLQTERPAFFTAVDLFGIRTAGVHTQLDLSHGETTGEGYDDTSLEALIVRSQREGIVSTE